GVAALAGAAPCRARAEIDWRAGSTSAGGRSNGGSSSLLTAGLSADAAGACGRPAAGRSNGSSSASSGGAAFAKCFPLCAMLPNYNTRPRAATAAPPPPTPRYGVSQRPYERRAAARGEAKISRVAAIFLLLGREIV